MPKGPRGEKRPADVIGAAPRLEDVELVPDAMDRLEGAIKHAARKAPDKNATVRRVAPIKPKRRRATRRP
jgi:hypothetical protein